MKKSGILITVFLLTIFSVVYAQQIDVNVNFLTNNSNDTLDIYYKPGVKLSWNNFQGIPRETERIAAETSSGIGYSYKFRSFEDQVTFDFEVYTPFRIDKSWVLNDEKKTAYTLNHEQRHFDISFINTLLFIKTLRNTNLPTKGFKKLISDKYNEASFALSKMQNEYDTQTRNGLDTEMQTAWNKKIDELILRLTKEILQ